MYQRELTDFIITKWLRISNLIRRNSESGEGEREAQAGAGSSAQGGAAVQIIKVEFHLSTSRLPNVSVLSNTAAAPAR